MKRPRPNSAAMLSAAAVLIAAFSYAAFRPPSPLRDDGAIDAKLETLIPRWNLPQMVLEEELRLLSEKTGLHFVVDWDRLKEVGAQPHSDMGTGLHRTNIRAWELLNLFLQEAERSEPLAWWVVGDRIHIGVLAHPPPQPEASLCVFDVQDLLDEAVESRLRREQENPTTRPAQLASPTRESLEAIVGQELQAAVLHEVMGAWKPKSYRRLSDPRDPLLISIDPVLTVGPTSPRVWSGKLVTHFPPAGQRRVDELLHMFRQRVDRLQSEETYRWGLVASQKAGFHGASSEMMPRLLHRPNNADAAVAPSIRVYDVADLLRRADRESGQDIEEWLSVDGASVGAIAPPQRNSVYLHSAQIVLLSRTNGTGLWVPLGDQRLRFALNHGLGDSPGGPTPPFFWLWADRVIVLQTPAGHQHVADFLQWLRNTTNLRWR